MVVFLVTRLGRSTLTKFFKTWGAGLAPSVELVYYEKLARTGELPRADTYVFTDLERLTPTGLRTAADLADQLAALHDAPRIINHPGGVMLRYELLRALHERSVNSFRAHHALPVPTALRYPVFLRSEHEHHVLTPLLRSRRDVERELVRANARGADLTSLLAVEYEDVADQDGMFHRYISHVIGNTIVPGYLAFNSHWVVKAGRFLDGDRLAQQRASVLTREYEPLLRQIAQLAGVGYGRVDYAVVEGRIHIWELNTNPTLLVRPEEFSQFALEEVGPLVDHLMDALGRLAGTPGAPGRPVKVRIPPIERVARLQRRPSRRAQFVRRLPEPLVIHALWLTRRRSILRRGQSGHVLREPPPRFRRQGSRELGRADRLGESNLEENCHLHAHYPPGAKVAPTPRG
jgi:hypothetical protein